MSFGGESTLSDDERNAEARELLDRINYADLEGPSIDFVAGMRERFDKYGSSTKVSARQLFWLRDLAQ